MTHSHPHRFLLALLALCLALNADLALAAAGKVLFASGEVQVERNGSRPLAAGDSVENGDVIVTGAKARAQLLMADGARIALRAGSRFRIDELTLPASVRAPGQASATAQEGSSIATLLKGGFRTSTGSIGKTDPKAYAVRAPVGVLGIRGTDYTMVLCQGDCTDAPGVRAGEAIRDGLYIGVTTGSVAFRTSDGREIVIETGQWLFIPLGTLVPERLPGPPPFGLADGAGTLDVARASGTSPDDEKLRSLGLRRGPTDTTAPADTESPADAAAPEPGTVPSRAIQGTDGQGRPVDITNGGTPQTRDLGISSIGIGDSGPLAQVATADGGAIGTSRGGELEQFPLDILVNDTLLPGVVSIGTSANTNTGSDTATGLGWGRWSGQQAVATVPGATLPIDLASSSLHWVMAASAANAPAMPQTGTANYTLVGNTDPTNTTGVVGTLGSATFDADFTNNTVASTLDLTVGSINWNATGAGAIGAQQGLPAHQFGGGYSVTITGGQVPTGSGGFAGFFSAPGGTQPGVPGGVGLSYTLIDDQGLDSVQGVAVFQGP